MVVFNSRELCKHNLSVNLRSGASVVNIKPVISHDSQYIIIACGSSVKVFVVKSGKCIHILKHHSRPVVSIRENKKNDLQVFSCSEDGVVVRWDYIEGKILQAYDLEMTVSSFYAPTASGPWFVTKPYEDHHQLYSLQPNVGKGVKYINLKIKPVQPKGNTVDFGFMGKFCASVFGNTLTTYELEKKSIRKHKTGDHKLTCVVCHPTEYVLATGDELGRIVVWSSALESNRPIRSIYHWHTLPVADLSFSFEGSYLYSGGGEAALVKWNLFSEERFILPRMGAAIVFVSASKDNKYVVTAHHDNALQVLDAQRTLVQVIQGLTKSYAALLTGLLYNPKLQALVVNGKPGHLQFYDIKQDKQLFNLDIADKNIMSQERDTTICNMDVHKAAVDESGLWLATSEFWSSGDTSPQIWLKFWKFDLEKQTFVLNTNVILPHNQALNSILFQPQSSMPVAATTSNDGRFKIWRLNENSSDGQSSWSCDSMGCYRGLPAGSASFSEEGSLLAVAFGSAATLWNVEGLALKAVLCNEKNKRTIKQLLFGCRTCCHFLISQDGDSITVWNILTLSISWIVHNEVQVLTSDASSHIAAFCGGQNLIIFTPDNPKPLFSFEKVSETPVISSLFVPSSSPAEAEGSCFHHSSQLFFINEAQNLYSVSEAKAEEEKSEMRIARHITETPFGLLQAEHKVSNVEEVEVELLSMVMDNKEHIIQDPLLQNPLALCSALLPLLLIPANKCTDTWTMTNIQEKTRQNTRRQRSKQKFKKFQLSKLELL